MTPIYASGSYDLVDDDGNVMSVHDFDEARMEVDHSLGSIANSATQTGAVARPPRRSRGRGRLEPVSGVDLSRMISEEQGRAEESLGRRLTNEEMEQLAKDVEWRARGGQ